MSTTITCICKEMIKKKIILIPFLSKAMSTMAFSFEMKNFLLILHIMTDLCSKKMVARMD